MVFVVILCHFVNLRCWWSGYNNGNKISQYKDLWFETDTFVEIVDPRYKTRGEVNHSVQSSAR